MSIINVNACGEIEDFQNAHHVIVVNLAEQLISSGSILSEGRTRPDSNFVSSG